MPILDPRDIWLLVSIALVLFMQAGFLCLEAGAVRSKNSLNVAIKNFVVEILTTCAFFTCGYALMFGVSWKGVLGIDAPALMNVGPERILPFLFQMVFCGTAATIVSGAVAERLRFLPFLLSSTVMASLLYPLYGHWVWGGGWLSRMGYHDFAGSSVVHIMGAGVGLAGILLLGPRKGRFANGKTQPMAGENLILSALGTFILFFGWIGFNGGSAPFGLMTGTIVANTLLAGCFAGMTAMSSIWITRGIADVSLIMNGTLGGLVAITACADLVPLQAAPLIGILAGLAVHAATWALERFEIDDAVGAVPVHGACGLLGILATPLFCTKAALATKLAASPLTSRVDWLGVQALGAIVCMGVAVGGGFLTWILIGKLTSLRVSSEGEDIGMNFSEHRL
jgi:Amt family ammonium transporter